MATSQGIYFIGYKPLVDKGWAFLLENMTPREEEREKEGEQGEEMVAGAVARSRRDTGAVTRALAALRRAQKALAREISDIETAMANGELAFS